MFPFTKYLLYFLRPIWYKDFYTTETDKPNELHNEPLEDDDTDYTPDKPNEPDNTTVKKSYRDALTQTKDKKYPYNLRSRKQQQQQKDYTEDLSTVIQELNDFFQDSAD